MTAVIPRQVVCVLREWNDLDLVDAIIRKSGVGFTLDREFSHLEPDERMIESFEASYDRVTPSMTEEDWQAIRGHSAVVYVLSPPLKRNQALEISGQTLLLTAALLKGGGVAAKGEEAGIAHGREKWIELAATYAHATKKADAHALGASLFWAWVRRPLIDEEAEVFYSCGMHLVGERDIEIDSSLDVDAAVESIYLACTWSPTGRRGRSRMVRDTRTNTTPRA